MVNVTGSVNIRWMTKLMVKKLCGVDMTRRVSVIDMLIAHLVVRIHHVL